MATRPGDFVVTTPSGGDSPRSGDDEIRRVKTYTQNAYNDLTQPTGVGINRTNLYGNTITAVTGFSGNLTGDVEGNLTGDVTGSNTGAHNGTVGESTPTTVVGTTITANTGFSGDLTGDVTGNSDTTSAWDVSKTITLTGAVTGTISGTDGNYSIATSLNTSIPGTVTYTGTADFSAQLGINGGWDINGTDVTSTAAELNYVDGVTSNIQTQLDGKQPLDAELTELATMGSATASALADLSQSEVQILDGATISTAELNLLDGVTATTTELNYVDGVTSAIQTQLNGKANLAGPTFTGTPAAPTATADTNTTQLATTAFVQQEIGHVVVIEAESAGDPVVGDFTNGALFVVQY